MAEQTDVKSEYFESKLVYEAHVYFKNISVVKLEIEGLCRETEDKDFKTKIGTAYFLTDQSTAGLFELSGW